MRPFQSIWFWSALVLPSLDTLVKYLSWPGAVLYASAVWVLLSQVHRLITLPRRAAMWCAGATGALVVAAFLVFHPMVDGQVAGMGSDDDEAHDLGVAALVRGQSPYAQRTYLGNELHQMPGAYVLAAPFALLGTSALQNLFWIGAFFVVAARETRDPRIVLALMWCILIGSPEVMAHVISGTGHPANAISVLLGLHWLERQPQSGPAAACWGVTLASRANVLVLLPVAFGWLRRAIGWSPAVRAIAIAAGTAVALALPFFLLDPQGFGPINAPLNRVFRFDIATPYLGAAFAAAIAIVTLTAAIVPIKRSDLWRRCALVLAFPAGAGTVLASVEYGTISLDYISYGMFASWFVFFDIVRARSADPSGADVTR